MKKILTFLVAITALSQCRFTSPSALVPVAQANLASTAASASRGLSQSGWYRGNATPPVAVEMPRTHVDHARIARALAPETSQQLRYSDVTDSYQLMSPRTMLPTQTVSQSLEDAESELLPRLELIMIPMETSTMSAPGTYDADGRYLKSQGSRSVPLSSSETFMSSRGMFRSSPVRLQRRYDDFGNPLNWSSQQEPQKKFIDLSTLLQEMVTKPELRASHAQALKNHYRKNHEFRRSIHMILGSLSLLFTVVFVDEYFKEQEEQKKYPESKLFYMPDFSKDQEEKLAHVPPTDDQIWTEIARQTQGNITPKTHVIATKKRDTIRKTASGKGAVIIELINMFSNSWVVRIQPKSAVINSAGDKA